MGHLYVGIGRQRITPKIGGHLAGYGTDVFSASVHDDLTATALVLQQNDLSAIWICETVCNLSGALVDEIKSEIRKKHPVPAENIMIAAIHTHSGPIVNSGAGWGDVDREYCDSIFIPQTLAAVDEAFSQMREAYMGVQETESLVGINRREYGPDGVVDFGQNPWGQQDKRMTVIAFQTPDGAPIANVVHYGAHCTAAGTNTEITRDWAGVMIDRLEAESGAPTLFLNGAAGDVGPRLTNGKTKGDINYVMELGSVAAQDAVRAYRAIRSYHTVHFQAVSGALALPYDPVPPLCEAQTCLAKYNALPDTNVHLRMRDYYGKIVHAYQEGLPTEKAKKINETVFWLGDVVLVPFGFELFSEISQRLRAYSPYPYTLAVGYANEALGYLPSQDQFCRGGYEVEMFKTGGVQNLADNTDSVLIQQTLALINKLG